MTQRIATAILLTVWAVLIAGGFAAYWVTRAVLVADLDRELDLRARTLAAAAARGTEPKQAAMPVIGEGQNRYVIRNELRTLWTGADTVEPAPHEAHAPPPQHAGFSRLGDGRWVRTVTVQVRPADPADPGGAITVTYSSTADALWRVLSRLALTLTVCGAAAGAGAAAVAVWVARAALRPLHDAARVVGDIDEARLDRRIDAESLPPELRPVALRLNEMLGRLEEAFAQRKRFLADAAHELRTPVAALVTTLEVALRRRRDAEELTRTMQACLADARHLKRLVHVLMEHARGEASAASRTEAYEAVDAAELLGECADLAAALGVARDVRVERSLPAPMPFVTQPQRLRSVVTNLLSNAVEYNRRGGVVRIAAELAGGALRVTVRDTGRGIAAEHLPYLFEPFYRAGGGHAGGGGESRRGGDPEETPHLGLGLFLVQSHLKALGGRCTVDSELGVGTTMQVTVPAGNLPGGVPAGDAPGGVINGPAAAGRGADRGIGGVGPAGPAVSGRGENVSGASAVLQGARE